MATDRLILLLITLVFYVSAKRLAFSFNKCKPQSCYCEFGHVMKNGCFSCECLPDPCASNPCRAGEKCLATARTYPGDSYARCIDPSLPVECQDPKLEGPCMAYFPAFYYDSNEKMCRSFVYGGCRGNRNRFNSANECRRRCEPEYVNQTRLYECKSVKHCYNFCPYGHRVDVNGCTQCSCKRSPCSLKHCKENEYCELEGCYGRHHCPNGRAVCKLTDGVIQIQVEVDVEHDPLEIKEKEKQEIKMLVKKKFSKLMRLQENNIKDIKIIVRNEVMFRLKFSVVTSASRGRDLIDKYYKLKSGMYNTTHSHMTYNSHSLMPNPETLIAKAESPSKTSDHRHFYMMTAIIAGCSGVVVLLAAIALVAVVRKRSSAVYRGSSNIPYRGMVFKGQNKEEDKMAIL